MCVCVCVCVCVCERERERKFHEKYSKYFTQWVCVSMCVSYEMKNIIRMQCHVHMYEKVVLMGVSVGVA